MDILDYLKKLEDKGYEAYIVGGYVRDKLLNIESSDIDITTNAKPKDVANIFDTKAKDNLGVINIKTEKYNIDITTYRKESHYIGHKPKKLSYVKDLKTDLLRRDFTINTICLNSKGDIIDLLGGQKDLEKKIIKSVLKPSKKFKEDPLRMLRALRFAIVYNFKINDEELIFILNNKKLFSNISYDRKKQELGKILISKNVINGLMLLKTLGLTEILEIEYDKIVKVNDYIGMWAQIDFSDNYSFTKLERERIANIREIVESKKVDKFTIFEYGYYDAFIASQILKINKETIAKINSEMEIHSKDELDIDSLEIKKLVPEDFVEIDKIKDKLVEEILNGKLKNKKDALKKYISKNWK